MPDNESIEMLGTFMTVGDAAAVLIVSPPTLRNRDLVSCDIGVGLSAVLSRNRDRGGMAPGPTFPLADDPAALAHDNGAVRGHVVQLVHRAAGPDQSHRAGNVFAAQAEGDGEVAL
jgi:hypothetical protein